MKKTAILLLLLSCASLLAAGGGRVSLSVGAGVLMPRDSGFKDVYGTAQVGAELMAGLRLYKGLHALVGIGYFPAKGTIPDLGDEAKASQFFVPIGVGWETGRSGRLQGDFHAALMLAGFSEKAMGDTASGSALGFDVGAGLRYYLKKALFLELAAGYAGAAGSVANDAGEVDIELGGLRLGCRLGFRL